MRRGLGSLLVVAVFLAAGVGCSVLLDFDKLRNGHDQGALVGDLAGADLTGVIEDLAGADLTGVDLAGVDMAQACVPTVDGVPHFDIDDSLTISSFPAALNIADVDGDGAVEMLVATYADQVTIYSHASGHTLVPATFNSGCNNQSPRAVLVGRFDGDAVDDLVVVCGYGSPASGQIALHHGTGSKTFAAPVMLSTVSLNLFAGVADDLDGDGQTDLVVTSIDEQNAQIYWGGTGFTTRTPIKLPTGPYGYSVLTGRLLGTGTKDIFVSSEGGDVGDGGIAPGRVVRFVQMGMASGKPAYVEMGSLVTASFSPVGLGLGHFDNGATLDYVVPGTDTELQLYTTDGSGAQTKGTGATVFGRQGYVAVGDLDCDGSDDVVVTHYQGLPDTYDRFTVLTSKNGLLTTRLAHDVAVGPDNGLVAIGDIDHDGHPDVAMVSADSMNHLRILWGKAMP